MNRTMGQPVSSWPGPHEEQPSMQVIAKGAGHTQARPSPDPSQSECVEFLEK